MLSRLVQRLFVFLKIVRLVTLCSDILFECNCRVVDHKTSSATENPDDDDESSETEDTTKDPEPQISDVHADNSYGINSDPLTHFAIIFSSLIHDVDHFGVSNAQLVEEGDRLARIFKGQSVLEQNSVNIAWDLLMDPAFYDLRNCIFTTEEEYVRFRQLVVNVSHSLVRVTILLLCELIKSLGALTKTLILFLDCHGNRHCG